MMSTTGGVLKRMILMLTVAAVMAALMVALASPAFAAKNDNNTNIFAQEVRSANVDHSDPGAGGTFASKLAQENGGLGDIVRHEPRRK